MVRLSRAPPRTAGEGVLGSWVFLDLGVQALGGVVRFPVAVQVAGIAVVGVFQPNVRKSGKPFFSRCMLPASETAELIVDLIT